MNDIELNLFAYTDKIQRGSLLNLHDEKVKAEDFFLRIFEKVYGFEELINLNYEKLNSKGIDLYDSKEKIGIQITAIQSNEKTKINDTKKLTLNNWKNRGLKKLWVFFIIETKYLKDIDTSIVEEVDGIKIYIKTIKNLIGDISKLDKEKRIEISELIKQEVSEEFYGLSKLVLFKEIVKSQKFDSTNYFNKEELIYFSKKEQHKIDNLAYNFTNNITDQYCILGNPCSGKTTIAYAIIQKIKNKKIFYLNLTEPIFDESKILEELIQISHCHSLIIVDNIHDNIKLFLKIKDRLSKHKWIKSLFLSRYYKTFDEFDENSIYDKIEGIKYYRIDLNEDLEDKISGIISKKIELLKNQFSEINWYKGNFIDILKNTSSNLLKLNIALRVWEKKNKISNNLTFDKINQNIILQNFYEEHKLNEVESDSIYTYCLLYKNDIPFILLKGQKSIDEKLKE
ncbi:SMEK domain-containing protein, partial [Flavobacterium psychrophilum]|nr:SMEK domain-containing protein [Flavobacterium psychrophilum]